MLTYDISEEEEHHLPLPRTWTQSISTQDNVVLYTDSASGLCSRIHPLVQKAEFVAGKMEMPLSWNEEDTLFADGSHGTYFVNKQTGQRGWDHPLLRECLSKLLIHNNFKNAALSVLSRNPLGQTTSSASTLPLPSAQASPTSQHSPLSVPLSMSTSRLSSPILPPSIIPTPRQQSIDGDDTLFSNLNSTTMNDQSITQTSPTSRSTIQPLSLPMALPEPAVTMQTSTFHQNDNDRLLSSLLGADGLPYYIVPSNASHDDKFDMEEDALIDAYSRTRQATAELRGLLRCLAWQSLSPNVSTKLVLVDCRDDMNRAMSNLGSFAISKPDLMMTDDKNEKEEDVIRAPFSRFSKQQAQVTSPSRQLPLIQKFLTSVPCESAASLLLSLLRLRSRTCADLIQYAPTVPDRFLMSYLVCFVIVNLNSENDSEIISQVLSLLIAKHAPTKAKTIRGRISVNEDQRKVRRAHSSSRASKSSYSRSDSTFVLPTRGRVRSNSQTDDDDDVSLYDGIEVFLDKPIPSYQRLSSKSTLSVEVIAEQLTTPANIITEDDKAAFQEKILRLVQTSNMLSEDSLSATDSNRQFDPCEEITRTIFDKFDEKPFWISPIPEMSQASALSAALSCYSQSCQVLNFFSLVWADVLPTATGLIGKDHFPIAESELKVTKRHNVLRTAAQTTAKPQSLAAASKRPPLQSATVELEHRLFMSQFSLPNRCIYSIISPFSSDSNDSLQSFIQIGGRLLDTCLSSKAIATMPFAMRNALHELKHTVSDDAFDILLCQFFIMPSLFNLLSSRDRQVLSNTSDKFVKIDVEERLQYKKIIEHARWSIDGICLLSDFDDSNQTTSNSITSILWLVWRLYTWGSWYANGAAAETIINRTLEHENEFARIISAAESHSKIRNEDPQITDPAISNKSNTVPLSDWFIAKRPTHQILERAGQSKLLWLIERYKFRVLQCRKLLASTLVENRHNTPQTSAEEYNANDNIFTIDPPSIDNDDNSSSSHHSTSSSKISVHSSCEVWSIVSKSDLFQICDSLLGLCRSQHIVNTDCCVRCAHVLATSPMLIDAVSSSTQLAEHCSLVGKIENNSNSISNRSNKRWRSHLSSDKSSSPVMADLGTEYIFNISLLNYDSANFLERLFSTNSTSELTQSNRFNSTNQTKDGIRALKSVQAELEVLVAVLLLSLSLNRNNSVSTNASLSVLRSPLLLPPYASFQLNDVLPSLTSSSIKKPASQSHQKYDIWSSRERQSLSGITEDFVFTLMARNMLEISEVPFGYNSIVKAGFLSRLSRFLLRSVRLDIASSCANIVQSMTSVSADSIMESIEALVYGSEKSDVSLEEVSVKRRNEIWMSVRSTVVSDIFLSSIHVLHHLNAHPLPNLLKFAKPLRCSVSSSQVEATLDSDNWTAGKPTSTTTAVTVSRLPSKDSYSLSTFGDDCSMKERTGKFFDNLREPDSKKGSQLKPSNKNASYITATGALVTRSLVKSDAGFLRPRETQKEILNEETVDGEDKRTIVEKQATWRRELRSSSGSISDKPMFDVKTHKPPQHPHHQVSKTANKRSANRMDASVLLDTLGIRSRSRTSLHSKHSITPSSSQSVIQTPARDFHDVPEEESVVSSKEFSKEVQDLLQQLKMAQEEEEEEDQLLMGSDEIVGSPLEVESEFIDEEAKVESHEDVSFDNTLLFSDVIEHSNEEPQKEEDVEPETFDFPDPLHQTDEGAPEVIPVESKEEEEDEDEAYLSMIEARRSSSSLNSVSKSSPTKAIPRVSPTAAMKPKKVVSAARPASSTSTTSSQPQIPLSPFLDDKEVATRSPTAKIMVRREETTTDYYLVQLESGIRVTKHCQGGSVKPRVLSLDSTHCWISWDSKKKNNDDATDASSKIHMDTVLEIKKGITTQVFTKSASRLKNLDNGCCMSIITSDRSLDVEFASRTERDMVFRSLKQIQLKDLQANP